jgi:WD40 repeat protein
VSAVDTVREVTASESPYVGLNFFTQENAAMFFGRDNERMVLISNLRASRLTLLYAQSGAGKSSLLRAGVAARLTELAKRGVSQRGTARNIPVVFSSWQDDPTAKIIAEIQRAIFPFLHTSSPPGPAGGRLDEAIEAANRATGATLLLILDQFEEYFLYRPREARNRPSFADELAACINRADLRVNFLISIREDAYSGLGDLFKGRISNVYGNYLHLEHLTREAAREAIEKPIASFNELHQDQAPIEIEPGLVDAVLDQLRPDQFASDQGGVGRLAEGNGTRSHHDEIAAPYLQLVMKRLWDAEAGKRSRELRLETLEELGGAQTIVRTHVDRALGDLPEEGREAAADILHHLVTPSGTKIALGAADLAEYTGRSAEETNALLERLAGGDTRILSTVPPPPGRTDGTRYEISHDLLAPAILDWGRHRRAVRLENEKEVAEREAQNEKRRARRFRGLAIGSAGVLVMAIILSVVLVFAELSADNASHEAQSRAVAARAEAVLSQDPELATKLALRALQLKDTAQAETSLRDALPQLQVKATLAPPLPERSAVFSPDGTQILTATADGTIRIWNAATDKQLLSIPGFGAVNDAAFSPDGKSIVTASNDGIARILNASTGKLTGILNPSGSFYSALSSVAFSPDGKLVVTTDADGDARIWDASTDRQLGPTLSADSGSALLAAAFSPDSKLVVTASSNGNARIYDARTGAQRGIVPHKYRLLDVAFSPDGKLIVTAGGRIATSWNASTDKLVRTLVPPDTQYLLFGAVFSPDGRQILTAGGDGVARIWDEASGRLVRTLGAPGHDSLQSAAFSPDGKLIVTASASGLVRVWDAASGTQVALLSVPAGANPLRSAIFSPDRTLAATGSQFGTVTIWRAPATHSGSPAWKQVNVINMPEADAINGMAFSRNGKLLATVGQSGYVYIWQVPSGFLAGEVLSGVGRPLNSVAFDPVDPDLVVTAGNDGYARVMNVMAGNQVGKAFGTPGSNLYAAAFSPDGKRIVTAGWTGYAQVWSVAAGHQKIGGTFGYGNPMTSVEYSGNGKEILTSENDGYSNTWDATQTTPAELTAFQESDGNVPHDAVFSPDASTVITAGTDGTAREWDASSGEASSGEQVLAFAGHSGPIYTVAFSGTEMITASSDGTAKIWDAEPIEQRGLLSGPASQTIYTATFDPVNSRIVATADGNKVSVWNTSNQAAAMKVLPVPRAATAEFSADGKFLVTAGNEKVQIWRMSDLSQPPEVLNAGSCPNSTTSTPSLYSATFNHDGSRVVTADQDGSACVWDVSNGHRIQLFTEPAGAAGGLGGGLGVGGSPVRWAVFSPDGKQVLTASDDGTARLWDVSSGKQIQVFSEPSGEEMNDAWFSPSSTQIVTASNDGTARIWSVATGTLLQTLSGAERSPVYNAAFSRNGQLVVTCSGSAAIIWSAHTGQQLTEFQYVSSFSDCEFSPDGSEVVTAGSDGQTRIFSTELTGGLQQIMGIAENRSAQPLSAAELKEYQASSP